MASLAAYSQSLSRIMPKYDQGQCFNLPDFLAGDIGMLFITAVRKTTSWHLNATGFEGY
jgi:hypothetical protein